MRFKPNVTVAAIIEEDGRFLFVEEAGRQGPVLNQPAGHLEAGETLLQAVIREALEETAHRFRPEALVGVYRWPHPEQDLTFLRFTFCGANLGHDPDRALDPDILRTLWLTPAEAEAEAHRLRSPLVLANLRHYLAGRRYPLDILTEIMD